MNILIITTYYPPDTAIASVRPYMLAKYLSKNDHKITVLRSGIIINNADDYYPDLRNVKVISYMGFDSPAEKFKRGEKIVPLMNARKKRLTFLPSPIKKIISSVYHRLERPKEFNNKKKITEQRLECLKKAIDNLKHVKFDVVFSTYGDLENIYAGEYAKQVLGCPWVMDFRDPVAQANIQTRWEYKIYKRIQDYAIQNADLCTAISNSILIDEKSFTRNPKIKTIYNGYEDENKDTENTVEKNNVLTICYTGQIYSSRTVVAYTDLIKAISILIKKGVIEKDKIRFLFAGSGSDELQITLRKHGIEDIFDNHGYVAKDEIFNMQRACDIFLVLSWNTKKEKGVLTGKFYEGIRAHKPILSLVDATTQNSELFLLNQQYHYGYCYETCNTEQFEDLCLFLQNAYEQKMTKGKVDYSPNAELFNVFRYDFIAKELESLFNSLIEQESQKSND